MIEKSLKSISWDVSEEQYRLDPAFSYSQIAAFFREGPSSLIKTDKDDTASLRGGSLVDTLLTAPEEFEEKFLVSSVKTPSELVLKVLRQLWDTVDDKQLDLEHIPEKIRLKAMNDNAFYTYWKDTTRLNKLQEDGYEYYRLMSLGLKKIIVSEEDVKTAKACAEAVTTNETTRKYFLSNPFEKDTENLYQLKFKTSIDGYTVRCMFDVIHVDHVNKTITPADLKTTGKNEEDFQHSFLQWCYFIQAELYYNILKKAILNDEYFKDFTLLPFRFIVVNRDNLSPLEWIVTENTYEVLRKAGYPSTWELIPIMHWHLKQRIFNYTKESYTNNFSREISLKFLKTNE